MHFLPNKQEIMESYEPVTAEPRLEKKSKFPWKWIALGLFLVVLGVWLWLTPPGFLAKLDAIGYAVCHRIDARSFHIHDRQVPLCARCTGMYLGAVLGIIFQFVQGKKGKYPPLWAIIILGLFVLAFIVDGSNSYLHFFPSVNGIYEPQNWSRLVTGMGMGLAMAAAVVPAFNQTIWKDWDDISAFRSWKQLGLLILVATVLTLLVLTEAIWVIIPVAVISALGVYALLVMIYTIVTVMIFKRDNTYTSIKDLLLPLICGATLAIIQIGVFDLARYLWTGTWLGFNL
jgi:uncharacterized membrane protein